MKDCLFSAIVASSVFRSIFIMPEHDPQVLSYRHLAQKPRADDALKTLKKVASVVKPIMRAHKWKVKELAEFYPNNPNLLGAAFSLQVCVMEALTADRS